VEENSLNFSSAWLVLTELIQNYSEFLFKIASCKLLRAFLKYKSSLHRYIVDLNPPLQPIQAIQAAAQIQMSNFARLLFRLKGHYLEYHLWREKL
jgi:hypothetical protein